MARARLFEYSTPEALTGCWLWTLSTRGDGYANKLTLGGKDWYAHRLSLFLFRCSFDPQLSVDHKCRNRSCVNPDHLEAVKQRINVLRGVSVVAQLSSRTHCKRGHFLGDPATRKIRRCVECNREKQRLWAVGYRARKSA